MLLCKTNTEENFFSLEFPHLFKYSKALASPHRLERLDVLAQCERAVEALAQETGMSVANASQHLQVLRAAHLQQTKSLIRKVNGRHTKS